MIVESGKEIKEKEDKKWMCSMCEKEKSSTDKKHFYLYEGFICSSCYEDQEGNEMKSYIIKSYQKLREWGWKHRQKTLHIIPETKY